MGEGAVRGRVGFNRPIPVSGGWIQVRTQRRTNVFTNDLKNKIKRKPVAWVRTLVPTKNRVDYCGRATGILWWSVLAYTYMRTVKKHLLSAASSAVVGGGGGGATRIAHAHTFGGARVGPSASVLAKQSVPSTPRAPVVPRPQNTTAGDRTGAIAGARVRACACVPSRTRFSSP